MGPTGEVFVVGVARVGGKQTFSCDPWGPLGQSWVII